MNVALLKLLHSRPTPERLAKVLVYLGVVRPSEVYDYDLYSLDYESYRTVEEMIKDYCRRTPREPVEGLLIEACRKLREMRGRERGTELLESAVESYLSQGIPLTNAVAYVVADPSMIKSAGVTPEEAVKWGFEYVLRISPESVGEFIATAKKLLYENKTQLGLTAKDIANIFAKLKAEMKKAPPKKEKPLMPVKYMAILKEFQQWAKTSIPPAVSTLAKLLAKEILQEEGYRMNPDEAPAELGRKIPILVVYWALEDMPQIEELLRLYPEYVAEVLDRFRDFYENIIEQSKVLARLGTQAYIPNMALSSVRRAIATSIFNTIMTAYRNRLRELELLGEVSPEEKRRLKKSYTETIMKMLELSDYFVPGTLETYKLLFESELENEIVPKGLVKIPALEHPSEKLEILKQILSKAKTPERKREILRKYLGEETLRKLEETGIKVDGQVKLYNGHLIYRVEAVKLGESWIDLVPLAIFLWYDPSTGRYYIETFRAGKSIMQLITLPEFLRWLMKNLNIPVPRTAPITLPGTSPISPVTKRQEALVRKILEEEAWRHERNVNMLENFGEAIAGFEAEYSLARATFPEVVEGILKGQNPVENLQRFLQAIRVLETYQHMKNKPPCIPNLDTLRQAIEYLRSKGVPPGSKKFGDNVVREITSYAYYCSFVEPI